MRPILHRAAPALLALLLAACAPMGDRRGGGPGGNGDERGGPGGGSYGRNGGPDGARGVGGVRSEADRIQIQLTETAQDLHLTPAQVVLWEAYAEKVAALMSDMLRFESPFQSSRTPAPQKIGRQVDLAHNRLAALEDIVDSAKKLYASLTPEQQVIADQKLAGTLPNIYATATVNDLANRNSREGNRDAGRDGSRRGGGMGGGGMGGPGGGGGGFGRF